MSLFSILPYFCFLLLIALGKVWEKLNCLYLRFYTANTEKSEVKPGNTPLLIHIFQPLSAKYINNA